MEKLRHSKLQLLALNVLPLGFMVSMVCLYMRLMREVFMFRPFSPLIKIVCQQADSMCKFTNEVIA